MFSVNRKNSTASGKAVEFFFLTPGKSPEFHHFSTNSLWRKLWRMWKSPVDKAVGKVDNFKLCKPTVMVNWYFAAQCYGEIVGAGIARPAGKYTNSHWFRRIRNTYRAGDQ